MHNLHNLNSIKSNIETSVDVPLTKTYLRAILSFFTVFMVTVHVPPGQEILAPGQHISALNSDN